MFCHCSAPTVRGRGTTHLCYWEWAQGENSLLDVVFVLFWAVLAWWSSTYFGRFPPFEDG